MESRAWKLPAEAYPFPASQAWMAWSRPAASQLAIAVVADARARAVADQAARAAAAVVGSPARHGPKVVPPEQSKTIARARAKATAARQRADVARARAAAAVTVSVTDPDSRLVPRKNDG
jgi:hypothetical protein